MSNTINNKAISGCKSFPERLKRNATRMSIAALASLIAATSSPSVVNAQENYYKINAEESFDDKDEVIEIPRYIDEEGNEQDLEDYIRYYINRSRQEQGKEKINDTDSILKSDLEASSFNSMTLYNDHININIYNIPYSNEQYSFIYNIGNIDFLYIKDIDALNNLSRFTNIHIGMMNINISNNEELRQLATYLTKYPVKICKLNVNNKDENVIFNGENIVDLSNIQGLEELCIEQQIPGPINGKKIGRKNDDLKTFSICSGFGYGLNIDRIAMIFSQDEIEYLEKKGIIIDELSSNRNVLDQLNKQLDEIVSYLYSKEEFASMSEQEKLDEVIKYIGNLYQYNVEVSGQYVVVEEPSDDPNQFTFTNIHYPPENPDESRDKQYKNGLFTPLISPEINGTDTETEELNAICGNYAALFVALWERIGGKAYYVSDSPALHAYCIASIDGAYCIVDPTNESFSYEDAINVTEYNGSEKYYTKEVIDRYSQALKQDNEKTEENKKLDERREMRKQELARKREERIRECAESIIEILKDECEFTYDENGNLIGIDFGGKKEKGGITNFFDKIFNRINSVLTIKINGKSFNIPSNQLKNIFGNLGSTLNTLGNKSPVRTSNLVEQCFNDKKVIGSFPTTGSTRRNAFIPSVTIGKGNNYAAGPVGPKRAPLITGDRDSDNNDLIQ